MSQRTALAEWLDAPDTAESEVDEAALVEWVNQQAGGGQ